MIFKEISDEILIDEAITDLSPAIYFITTLYCNESIKFPEIWNSLQSSVVYTTEYIARILYAYLDEHDKFRILDTKPMDIFLSNKKHVRVTTFIDKGINRNCALLFECKL